MREGRESHGPWKTLVGGSLNESYLGSWHRSDVCGAGHRRNGECLFHVPSADLPREDVPTLLNQLSCTEYILGLALDHGALAITSFGVGQPETSNGFINAIPFQLGFVASLDNVKRFLHRCGSGPQYVAVDNLSLRALRDLPGVTNFEVQVSLTTTWILDKPAVTISEEDEFLGGGEFGGFGAFMRRMKATGAEGPDAFPGFNGERPGR